jgi:hypothetical protein
MVKISENVAKSQWRLKSENIIELGMDSLTKTRNIKQSRIKKEIKISLL